MFLKCKYFIFLGGDFVFVYTIIYTASIPGPISATIPASNTFNLHHGFHSTPVPDSIQGSTALPIPAFILGSFPAYIVAPNPGSIPASILGSISVQFKQICAVTFVLCVK